MRVPRVRIVPLSAETFAALAEGDRLRAESLSPVPLSAWLAAPENAWTWAHRAQQVVQTPADLGWVTGVVWDADAELAVGRAGFHAAPDPAGMVEIGYATDPARRRRGYARAALEALLARARREPTVRTVRVSISPGNTASLALIAAYPFVQVGEQWDEEDGLELVLEMPV